jgi:undecaprenyl-diphosphatase
VQLLVLGAGGALVVALASMFAEIMEAVIEQDDLTVVDRPVLAWLAAHHGRELTQIQIGITNLGSALGLAVMLVAAAVAAAAKLRSWRPIIVAVVVAGGIQLLVYAIKVFISRPRPAVDGRLVDAAGFSFPSGHSASAIACLGAVAWIIAMMARSPGVRATAWIAAGFLTFAIGLSRAYLGVHYPSDIIGGWILGATWLITVGTAAAVAKGWKRPAAGPRQKAT